jgi:cold shock CspA family protein
MLKGKITRLLKDGRGYIETHDGAKFDFHRDSLEDVEFDELEIGQAVEFMQNFTGNPENPCAVQVRTSL